MAMALGILARGVLSDGRPLEGVVEGIPTPTLEGRPPGLGVLYGEFSGLVGEPKPKEARVGDGIERLGLAEPVAGSREFSCFAVMFRYFDAIEPLVIFCSRPLAFPRPGAVGVLAADLDNSLIRDRAAGVVLGVIRPRYEGVTRPLDGVMRPLGPPMDGVARPPRDEATEDGR